jgi:hypothetical protein
VIPRNNSIVHSEYLPDLPGFPISGMTLSAKKINLPAISMQANPALQNWHAPQWHNNYFWAFPTSNI